MSRRRTEGTDITERPISNQFHNATIFTLKEELPLRLFDIVTSVSGYQTQRISTELQAADSSLQL
jgi:hypothetical protein